MLIIIMLIPFHTKCLPVSICKIITHKITKTTPHAYRLLQLTALHCTALHCTALHCTALHLYVGI